MRRNECDRFIEQHHSDHVLQADVWYFAVVHDGGFGRGKLHRDLFYLGGFKRLLLTKDFNRVERRVDMRADGPSLDVGARYFVALAELVDETGGIRVRIVGSKEIVFPREDVVDTGPAGLNEQRGSNCAARRHAAEVEGFLNM